LNRAFQLSTIFSHPCAAYRQLKFCAQPLRNGLCKRAKFQVKFRPDKPDHSLVRVITYRSVILWWPLSFGCAVNLVESTHRNVTFRGCTGQFVDSCQRSWSSFEILARWY
jgi:hypothetical protein